MSPAPDQSLGHPALDPAFLADLEQGKARRYVVLTAVEMDPKGARVELLALVRVKT